MSEELPDPITERLYERAQAISEQRSSEKVVYATLAAGGLVAIAFFAPMLYAFWTPMHVAVRASIAFLLIWASGKFLMLAFGLVSDPQAKIGGLLRVTFLAIAIFVITGIVTGWPSQYDRGLAQSVENAW